MKPLLALDIGPLGERWHTGIANVAKFLAREALGDAEVEPLFFMNRTLVPRALVERLVDLDGGELLWWLLARLEAAPKLEFARRCVAIYTAAKTHRRLFPFEAQIVHDLTTLVTPQFHTPESNAFWQSRLQADMLTSDLIVAVSDSTLADIHDYFPAVRAIPAIVAPLAPCCGAAPRLDVEDYVLVLGTLEPRKNVGVVLECLAAAPALLDRAKFVFVGRWGWGAGAQEIVAAHGLEDAVRRGRIAFTGFVCEDAKNLLLANARLAVYPSRYEGFGLPVIEAMHYGVPVIASYSSSLPQVGGDHATYVDFNSAADLAATIARQLADDPLEARAGRQAWARQFGWSRTYATIKSAALKLAEAP